MTTQHYPTVNKLQLARAQAITAIQLLTLGERGRDGTAADLARAIALVDAYADACSSAAYDATAARLVGASTAARR